MNGQPNISDNSTKFNVTGDQADSASFSVYDLDSATVHSILYGLCAFSVLTVLANGVFLLITWYIKIGSSTAILFMRCLCLGDILVGVYGIFKTLLLQSLENRSINCFLPESMFISTSTVHCSVLLWWNIDSYIRLAKPLQYINITNKVSRTTVMIFLWNVASIIGVLPQIGWNTHPFVCNFFEFYTVYYIILLNAIWSGMSVGSWVMQYLLVHQMRSIHDNTSIMPLNSREYSKCTCIITIIRMDMSLWMCSYIPFLIYISIYFTNQQYIHNKYSNVNLIFFLAIFMLRSFLSAIVHCYGSLRIRRVMKMIGRDLTNNQSANSTSEVLSSSHSDTNNLLSVAAVIHGQAKKSLQLKTSVSPSDVTILEEGPEDGIDNQAMTMDSEQGFEHLSKSENLSKPTGLHDGIDNQAMTMDSEQGLEHLSKSGNMSKHPRLQDGIDNQAMNMDSEQGFKNVSKSENMSKQVVQNLLHPEKGPVFQQGVDFKLRRRSEEIPGRAELFLRELEHASKRPKDPSTRSGVNNVAMTTF